MYGSKDMMHPPEGDPTISGKFKSWDENILCAAPTFAVNIASLPVRSWHRKLKCERYSDTNRHVLCMLATGFAVSC